MSNFYTIKTTPKGCLDMSKPGSTSLCYRMTYQNLKIGNHGLEIKNPFIVYILHAKNYEGKDFLYIGKSKNGILHRPKKHEDKGIDWDTCYVITQFLERTILNDGTIQYLEDILSEKAKETNCYNVVTQQTTKGTANSMDEINCEVLLNDVLEMLFVLGLDLKTKRNITQPSKSTKTNQEQEKSTSKPELPDGIYHLRIKLKAWDNNVVEGSMRVENGKYIVQKGSTCCPIRGNGWKSTKVIDNARKNCLIENNILQEDVEFNSTSLAAAMLTWRPENGWEVWLDETDEAIDKFRDNEFDVSRKANRIMFWNSFDEYIQNNQISINPTGSNKDSWKSYSIGSSDYYFIFSLVNRSHFIRVEFAIRKDKTIYDKLLQHKEDIENNLDFPIYWDRKDGRKYCHIYSKVNGLDFKNHDNWENLMAEATTKCQKMQKAITSFLQ